MMSSAFCFFVQWQVLVDILINVVKWSTIIQVFFSFFLLKIKICAEKKITQ